MFMTWISEICLESDGMERTQFQQDAEASYLDVPENHGTKIAADFIGLA